MARSITTCAPAMASLRPSPVMLLTPLLGEAATTSWPPWRRMATVFEPIRPVPPMTTIFMVYAPLSTAQSCNHGVRRFPQGCKHRAGRLGSTEVRNARVFTVRAAGMYRERFRIVRRRFPSVDAPSQARENVGIVVARGRMLPSVRPPMRQEDSRRPVWEFADRVQFTLSVLEALWKALVVPAPSRRLLRHTLLPLAPTPSRSVATPPRPELCRCRL